MRGEASEEVARAPVFFITSRGRGVGGASEEEAREGEGRRGNACGERGGGGLNIFLGAEMPTKKRITQAHPGPVWSVSTIKALFPPAWQLCVAWGLAFNGNEGLAAVRRLRHGFDVTLVDTKD